MAADKGKWTLVLFMLFLFVLMYRPESIGAHSALLEANPSINSHVDQPPSEIQLKFNERLEKELYYIHLFDEQGNLVTENETQMSQDQTEIWLSVPRLHEGNYTVSYQVISADGHPISQAYLLSVGNVAEKYDPNRYAYSADHGNAFIWFIRTLYYFSLLALCGLVIWKYIFPTQDQEGGRKSRYDGWLNYAIWSYFFFLILLGVIQFFDILGEFGIGDVPAAFLHTTSGQAWCSSLVLIVLGVFLFGRRKGLDIFLITSLIVAEGMNGHSMTNPPVWLSIFSDVIHLAAASIWLGGLAYLLIIWDHRENYLLRFSQWALWSIVAILCTGISLTLIYVPTLSYLFRTQWGILILVKGFLTLCVIAVASIIRRRMSRSSDSSFQFWLKWDYAILGMIVFIVGGLTISSPIPTNDPFIWNERQNNLFMNMEITPNNPGVNNTFNMAVELPKEKKVKEVELSLIHQGEQKIAPILVPLKHLDNSVPEINRYSYTSVGPYLSIPGTWMVKLEVSDQEDNWTEFKKEMTIYPIPKK
ncbi:MAG TPA: copper resistance protein CopC [Bacillota bacterium]|nr:copper resistance protein CopC [Bacillota bacterium]